MDMEGLHSFVAVAREKSISKAAQALHVTQPTLSARIRKLEDGLGVTLIERGWEGVRLTKQGRFFLTYSVQLFQELEEAATLLRKRESPEPNHPIEAVAKTDRLRIGIESFLNPSFAGPVIQTIQHIAPNAECTFVSKSSTLLLNMLESGGLDLCVGYLFEPRPSLRSVKLMEEEAWLLFPSSGYPDIRDDLSNVRELYDKPFILFDNSPLLLFRDFTAKLFRYLFDRIPERFHIVDNVAATLDILSSGFGYTFMPGTSISHLPERRLPFRRVKLPSDFLISAVYLTCQAAQDARLPLDELKRGILDRLASREDKAHPFAGDSPIRAET